MVPAGADSYMKHKFFLNKTDVSEILDISEHTALKTIRDFNKELKEQGFITFRGKVPAKMFMERYGVGGEFK